MTVASPLKSKLENILEKPFFEVEMARVEMMKAQPGKASIVPVALLAIYGTAFTAFCGYWAVKYIF